MAFLNDEGLQGIHPRSPADWAWFLAHLFNCILILVYSVAFYFTAYLHASLEASDYSCLIKAIFQCSFSPVRLYCCCVPFVILWQSLLGKEAMAALNYFVCLKVLILFPRKWNKSHRWIQVSIFLNKPFLLSIVLDEVFVFVLSF